MFNTPNGLSEIYSWSHDSSVCSYYHTEKKSLAIHVKQRVSEWKKNTFCFELIEDGEIFILKVARNNRIIPQNAGRNRKDAIDFLIDHIIVNTTSAELDAEIIPKLREALNSKLHS